MSRKRKLINMQERCRLCLVDQGCMSNLFDEVLQPKLTDLSKCTSISIKDEHSLPNIICHICLYKLEMWNEFKEQFIRSNQMLLSQLELVEYSDKENLECKKICIDLEQTEDSLSDSCDKGKKAKTDSVPLPPFELKNMENISKQTMLKDMYISEDEVTSSKDSSQKIHASNDDKCKNDENEENAGNSQQKSLIVAMKAKPITGKRSRTTAQRKASTKRWVARKKALLEATGESMSDSDSLVSDDTQLSPVQKARAKTNIDKEIQTQKRLDRVMKNLETTIGNKYSIESNPDDIIILDSDSGTHGTQSIQDINSDASLNEGKKKPLKKSSEQDATKKDKIPESAEINTSTPVSLAEITIKRKVAKENGIDLTEDVFIPSSVKSELEVGDSTYIVTSTLTLAEPSYLNKKNLNTLAAEDKNDSTEQNSQEKNTDIIDAVQLRRINPIPMDSSDKKCIERCLNIEVEGTEIEALKRVQAELAGFMENEMKHRFYQSSNNDLRRGKEGGPCKSSYQTLDQQLKTIIEKTIKKNFETSMMRSCNSDFNFNAQGSGRVSPEFVKEVMNSKKYQPKVVLKRLDIVKESKLQNINNMHVAIKRTVKSKLGGPFSMVSHKRQSVPPIRYNDYNTSALDSDSYLSEEIEVCESTRTENQGTQKLPDSKKQSNLIKQGEERSVAISGADTNEYKVETEENIFQISSPNGDKHICGICEQSFNNREDAITHIRMHKADTAPIPRQNKHKMMRCKRCHEIVEARFVKAHVCKSTKQHIHKCYVCNSTFRSEKLLVRHLDSHDQSEFNIDHIIRTGVPQSSTESVHAKPEKNQAPKGESNLLGKLDNSRLEMKDNQVDRDGSVGARRNDSLGLEKPKETYTCFVCDKIFTDEEILKDHLQKHCDDMSEDDRSLGKEQYQCAICGDSLESEDALETHVEKHLFDEEDDNPNLINIASENDKSKDDSYRCLQCEEIFNSEMLLEMHMQAHEEEAAIAEWEKQGIKTYEYQCMICDELFETEEDLSEHLDIHNCNAHVCQLCDKPFSSLEDLQKHVATH